MKKIVTLLLIALSINCFGNDSTKVNSINSFSESQTERIIDKYGGKVVDGFNVIASEVAPMAKEGFEMVVALKVAEGVVYLIPLLVLIISLVLSIKEYNRVDLILRSSDVPSNMNSSYGVLDDPNFSPKLGIGIVFIVISLLMSLFYTFDGVTHIIAPEWYAIKDIIELIK